MVRDLLLEGRRLAVLVRRDRKRPAAERVEGMLRGWEAEVGRPLPRPTVLEGDLSRPLCGLDARAIEWIGDHCDEVLHNAASLTFRGADRDNEPWRSNVGGTRETLAVAAAAGLRHFHHVSTAYVCGLRCGTAREDEGDVGQEFSNDYERSKVEAEQMVRAADHLDTATIHRPSIIVGDSGTGFTSTYHGFYAALRLGHMLLTRVLIGSTSGPAFLAMLGLDPAAGKNFVPVDWVSSAIVHAACTPAARGRIYHLTNPRPVPVDIVGRVIQKAIESFSQAARPDDPDLRDGLWFNEMLGAELDVYRGYLRNDPLFDRTNTDAVMPHLPCPELDEPSLMRMARFAIEHNFGSVPPQPPAAASAPTSPRSGRWAKSPS
jgi:thioester reductase-like protein